MREIFQIEFLQQFQHLDFGMIAVLPFLFGISNAFFYCYFGKISTESYEKMRDCLFDLKWHELPIATQKYFILMAANMQRPLRYHGFTVLDLNLETFTRVGANSNHVLNYLFG